MYENELKELEYISQAVGKLPDYVQGGGGNTSVKLGDGLMAVKASGFKLTQINTKEGFVVVNYENIIRYYDAVDLNSGLDYEKDSVEFVKKNIVEREGVKTLRPSVEAGFHSILKKYVVHTHSVYANILCCTLKGRELMDAIFGDEYSCIWIPYINPGFNLTLKISEQLKNSIQKTGKFPVVIFMENHGLIVTSDDCKKCVELHAEINDLVRDYLKIKGNYPEPELIVDNEGKLLSKTRYIRDFINKHTITSEFFDQIALYPDQLVYLNGSISADDKPNKLNINTRTGDFVYSVSYNEALTIEETLLGYFFVVNEAEKRGLSLKTMNSGETDFIRNWESESYRKKLADGF